MHGESYRRDVDCDGDGHFDHVCKKDGHAGYISSSQDCLDTWEEGESGLECRPHTMLESKDVSIPYQLKADYGNCVQHDSSQCFASHEGFSKSDYPVGVCAFHVEWTQQTAAVTEGDATGCEKSKEEPDESLWLEVVQMDTEAAVFNHNGWLHGDRLTVNGVNVRSSVNEATKRQVVEFVPVKDKDVIKWSTDDTVQGAGWLVCLRLKKKIPEVHKASCSEIGDDVWSLYYTRDDPRTVASVECDMKACNKADVVSVTPEERYIFRLTTNICDAGWKAARSSKFDVAFTGATAIREATFEILL